MDMSAVIVAKSDQWNADDFAAGARTFTIEDVSIKPGQEQPVSIKLAGSDKVFRPCKTVSRILVAGWGADANAYRGRSITLYTDPAVTWGGMKVGGIRVSHMTDLERPLVIALQEKKGSRKMTTVQPLKVDQAVDKAAEWATAQLALIAAAADIEALDRIEILNAKPMARLRSERIELHNKVSEAVEKRRDELTNPAATEGSAESDMGEGFTADPEFDA